MSAGWKLVSFLLSKPAANSILGTLHVPKLPIALEVPVDPEAADEVGDAAAAVVDAAEAEATALLPLPVPATTLP